MAEGTISFSTNSLVLDPGLVVPYIRVTDGRNNAYIYPTTVLSSSTGPTGPLGNTGPQGITGPAGRQGNIGPPGLSLPGPTGPTGKDGMKGVAGSTGPTGADGIKGVMGPTGADGMKGIMGNTGPTGADGMKGIMGNTGPTGADGPIGPTGADGPTGSSGDTGNTGDTGPTGPGFNNISSSDASATIVTLDNLQVQIPDSGTISLQIAANSDSFTANMGGYEPAGYFSNRNVTVLPEEFTYVYPTASLTTGDVMVAHVNDITNNKMYRITGMVGPDKNVIVIERLYP